MNRYIATFHTHFAALKTFRTFRDASVAAELAPVPRALSADCGTCVRYDAETPCRGQLHCDFDRVVLAQADGSYQTVVSNDAP